MGSEMCIRDSLTIDVRVSALATVRPATYDIACVVETGKGLQTVTYSAHGGTTRHVSGRRFKSCGMRVSGANAPNVELWLREGARVVYRSGKLSGPGTVVYRPNT